MSGLIKKLALVSEIFSQRQVEIKLFCLIRLQEGGQDIILSSKQLPEGDMEVLREVIRVIHSQLEKEEILKISRVILLDPSQPFVTEMADFLERMGNPSEFFNVEINEMEIKHAYIIVSPVGHDHLAERLKNMEKKLSLIADHLQQMEHQRKIDGQEFLLFLLRNFFLKSDNYINGEVNHERLERDSGQIERE